MDNGAATIYWFKTDKKWHASTNGKTMCGKIDAFLFEVKLNKDNTLPPCKTCKRAVRTLNRAMSACCC